MAQDYPKAVNHQAFMVRPSKSAKPMTRRRFLTNSLALAGWAGLVAYGAGVAPQVKLRAAIIGATGRGNYGHEHDLIFNGREDVQVVAVADADADGRAKARSRSGALRGYADYREMLNKEKPQLVCIAPRWTDQHHAMAMAALQSGAHLYLEKPVTQTLAEADEVLALADRTGRKIAVAHQMRLAPNVLQLKESLAQRMIGELLEIRSHGKQDHRAGGEDLVVLGVHLFDLMRFYAGDAVWCSARVLQNGQEIRLQDAHRATEGIGPVAGDEIIAQFAFARGVQGSFVSRAANREAAGPWGLELIGSQGRVRILTEMVPTIYLLKPGKWQGNPKIDQWHIWEEDPMRHGGQPERGFQAANARVLDDWLTAIRTDGQAVCSGYAGMKALEMALAVFAAGLSRDRVELPMKNRRHPLLA